MAKPENWFSGTPLLKRLQLVRIEWRCPQENCTGEMIADGSNFPSKTPAFHHTCNRCRFEAELHEAYPQSKYEEMQSLVGSMLLP